MQQPQENAQSPSVVRRVDGKTRVGVAADGKMVTCKNVKSFGAFRQRQGAAAWGHVDSCASEHRRNFILYRIFNQWRPRRSRVTCSDRLAEDTNRAAAFSTRIRSDLEIPVTEITYTCWSSRLCWRRVHEVALLITATRQWWTSHAPSLPKYYETGSGVEWCDHGQTWSWWARGIEIDLDCRVESHLR